MIYIYIYKYVYSYGFLLDFCCSVEFPEVFNVIKFIATKE